MQPDKFEIPEDRVRHVHFCAPRITGSITLCGWADVESIPVDPERKVTCPVCIEIVEFCKKIKL